MDTQQQKDPTFEGWAFLELMGHRKLAGFVREQNFAGAGLIRIDVPGEDGNVATQFYSPAALYCLTPTTEEMARRFAKNVRPEPVTRWELPPATKERREDLDDGELEQTDDDDDEGQAA